MSGSGQTLVMPGQQLNGYGYSAGAPGMWEVYIGGAPPLSPVAGTLWFDSVGVALYVYYNDGNSSQWVPATTAPPGPAGPPGASGTYQTGPGLHINTGTTPPTIDVATPYLALTGGTLTGSLTSPSLTVTGTSNLTTVATNSLSASGAQIGGVTNGSNAAAGAIGEFLSSVVLSANTVALPTGVAVVLTTLSVTAGDWDIAGEVWINPGSPNATILIGAIGPATTFSADPALNESRVQIGVPSGGFASTAVLALTPARVSVTATTTLNLLAQQGSGTGANAYGKITARRAR